MDWERKFSNDPTAPGDICEHNLHPYRKCVACEESRAEWYKAQVLELEAKLQKVIEAWYFPPENVADPTVGLVMCMCGNRLKFRDGESRVDRSVNCSRCGRRWIWRWAEGKWKP